VRAAVERFGVAGQHEQWPIEAVVGAPKVADVGAQQRVGAQAGKKPGKDEGAVAFDPVAARRGSASELRVASSAATESVGSAFGSVLARLVRPTSGIGLAASCTLSCVVRVKVARRCRDWLGLPGRLLFRRFQWW
jgi:hypothetical protein